MGHHQPVSSNKVTSILLFSENGSLSTEINTQKGSKRVDLVVYKEREQVEKHMNSNKRLNAIFIDMQSPHFNPTLIKSCHEYRFAVPIYLISDTEIIAIDNKETRDQLGIQGVLQSLGEVLEVIKVVDQNINQFDIDLALKSNSSSADPLEKDGGPNDSDFSAINAENFLSGSKNLFDVYVKLRERKYIKVLNAGDSFEPGAIKRYLTKGLKYFYVKQEAQKTYLKYCDVLTTKILASNKVSKSVKTKQVLNHGQETLQFLKKQGLDKESLEFCYDYAANVNTLMEQFATQSEMVSHFIGNLGNFEHCTGTALVSGLIGRAYGFNSSELTELLGVASMLHDIGLFKRENTYSEDMEDLKYFDEEEIELELEDMKLPVSRRRLLEGIYYGHTVAGVEIAKTIPKLNPLIIQVIGEHHQRVDRSGFPEMGDKQVLHPMSQVIGVADEFSKVIKMVRSKKIDHSVFMDFPEKVSSRFSGDVFRAFMQVFESLIEN